MLNALLMPVVAGYLDKLTQRMRGRGLRPAAAAGAVERRRVQRRDRRARAGAAAALGPVGRSAACALLGRCSARPTSSASTWAAPASTSRSCATGTSSLVTQGEIDRMPVRLPMVEIRTIGAGGGSIAKVARRRAADGRARKRRRQARARPATAAAAPSRR